MILYKTIQEYADICKISLSGAEKRLRSGQLEKVEAVKGIGKIAGYVDVYEANLYFANQVFNINHKIETPKSTLGKAEYNKKIKQLNDSETIEEKVAEERM